MPLSLNASKAKALKKLLLLKLLPLKAKLLLPLKHPLLKPLRTLLPSNRTMAGRSHTAFA